MPAAQAPELVHAEVDMHAEVDVPELVHADVPELVHAEADVHQDVCGARICVYTRMRCQQLRRACMWACMWASACERCD